ncbi:MAG: GNAT family N-acetyltransferase, partial [Nitrososphaerota archaeon]|nr:GNAT family N-acetyltransferase [Nitrososphaerota archaeon]
RRNCDAAFLNDLIVVRRGEETLNRLTSAVRLSGDNTVEYAPFGASFNIHGSPLVWAHEILEQSCVLGIMSGGKLVSVASLVAWLPKMAVIQGVETKPEFRGKGFGSAVVSAAVQEGLKRSDCCSLSMRSGNEAATLYRR